MNAFKLQDLQNRPEELVREVEDGQLSVVTKQGRPLFVVVPTNERLAEAGVFEVLAVKLYSEGSLSLGRAAQLAGQTTEAFLETLAISGVDVVSYPAEELADELAAFG